MNESYTAFAPFYDEFMDNVPYEEWAGFIINYLKNSKINNGLVLDLGCGSGIMTRLLAEAGYDMIGVDSSFEMLQLAKEKSSEDEILYLCQDMREFELYGTVAAVVSVCDSINYITEEEELLTVFKLVNNYLEAGGLFLFDVNSPFKFRELLADNTIAEDREDKAFIWDNYFDEESGINEYALSLFVKKENGDYARYCELHYEKCYELEVLKQLLEKAGMEFVAAYADYSEREYTKEDEECERIVIAAREKFQAGKKYN